MAIDSIDDVPGATELRDWFGYIPSFHDAYITDLSIDLSGHGRMRVRAFRMTRELDARGHYVQDKHCAVRFEFEGIQDVDLDGFTGDAGILDQLNIRKVEAGFSVDLDPVYGVGGAIVAKKVSLACEPIDYDGNWPPR
jgi:hypothetical protein